MQFSLAVPRSVLRASRLSVGAMARRASRTVSVPELPVEADDLGDGADTHVVDLPEPDDAVEMSELPIEGYDDLAARQVVDRLAALEPDDLVLVERYERANRNRSTVLGMIRRLSA